MTRENFEKLYGEQLKLSEKKWMLMSPKANKENNLVVISGYKEIDFDYLYFFYKDEVWEMDLKLVRFYEQEFYITRELFQLCLNSKKNISYIPEGNDILYRGTGVKGQIIVALDYWAKKIKSVLDSVITIQVPKEVLETKSILENTAFTDIHVNKKTDIFEKFEEDAHKEVAAEIFKSSKTIEHLRFFLKDLGYHSSIIDYVCKSVKIERMCDGDDWNMSYLDVLIEDAKFEEDVQRKALKEASVLNSEEVNKENSKGARKNDSLKVSYSDLPPFALEQVAKAFNYGSRKYSKFNYREGMEYLRYYDACFRHLQEWIKGKDIDESGNTHLSHAVASLLMLMENINLSTGVDDRPKQID